MSCVSPPKLLSMAVQCTAQSLLHHQAMAQAHWLTAVLLLLLLQNVDVIRKPQMPTSPIGIQTCSRQLMPWSVFPCYPLPAPEGYPNPNQRSK
jgi:hypothetical protein